MKKILILFLLLLLLSGCTWFGKEEKAPLIEEPIVPMPLSLQEQEQKKVVQADNGSIYYLAADNKRYIFPTEGTYKSWFGDYSDMLQMTVIRLQAYPIGGNVTYKPGSLIETDDDKRVYFVDLAGVVRAFEDKKLLEEIYGKDWKDRVDYVPIYYFTNYEIGEPITGTELTQISEDITIDEDKGLAH